MNQMENRFYQRMARSGRYRYNRGGPGNWPGKPLNAPAVTLYPNILAELDALVWPNIELVAEFAHVSPEIIAAVVEDGEELALPELLGAARILSRPPEYLASSTLAMIDPATKKGKRRLWELERLLDSIGDFLCRGLCERIRDELKRGERITYASWCWAYDEVEQELKRQRDAERARLTTRRERKAKA